jgi:hypothetical protein
VCCRASDTTKQTRAAATETQMCDDKGGLRLWGVTKTRTCDEREFKVVGIAVATEWAMKRVDVVGDRVCVAPLGK